MKEKIVRVLILDEKPIGRLQMLRASELATKEYQMEVHATDNLAEAMRIASSSKWDFVVFCELGSRGVRGYSVVFPAAVKNPKVIAINCSANSGGCSRTDPHHALTEALGANHVFYFSKDVVIKAIHEMTK